MTDRELLELAAKVWPDATAVLVPECLCPVCKDNREKWHKFAALVRREALLEVADLLGDKWFATQNEVELTVRALAAQEGDK